jgi:glucosamine 6-phosphate synthetase-like amidotransferase/phosphosugar isomerase protein
MCGIVGLIALERKSFRTINDGWRNVFKNLLCEAQEQGTEATGVFLAKKGYMIKEGGTIVVHKSPVAAKQYVNTDDFGKIINDGFSQGNTLYMVGHTRLSTGSTALDNKNNHPFVSGRVVGVHNGMIFNYKQIQKEEELTLKGKCDSEVIFSLMDKNINGNMTLKQCVTDACNELDGWFACIATDVDNYKKLIMFRHNAPLVIKYDVMDRILLFASKDHWITNAMKNTSDVFSTRKLDDVKLENDTCAIIDTINDYNWNIVSKFKIKTNTFEMEQECTKELSERNYKGPFLLPAAKTS